VSSPGVPDVKIGTYGAAFDFEGSTLTMPPSGQLINPLGGNLNAPTFSSRSGGTRIVMWPETNTDTVDYAIGMDSYTMWHSIPKNDDLHYFKWYGGTTEILQLRSDGKLTLSGGLTFPNSGGTQTIAYLGDASTTQVGGIKFDGVTLALNGSGQLYYTGGGSGGYTLPIASAGTLGGVKVGTGLSIDGSGILSSTITQYTDALARAAISVSGSLSYDNSTGVISYTTPTYTVSTTTASNGGSLSLSGTTFTFAPADVSTANAIPAATMEPMGHADKSQSTISFSDSARTFAISPVSTSYDVWVKGVKFTISTTRTVTIPNNTGLYYIYFDSTGALQYQTSFFDWPNQAPTAYVYWNSGTGKAPLVADERHGITLDWATHEYLHRTRGAAIANGFGASNYILNGNGSLNTHIQVDFASGTFFDEDLRVDVVSTNTPTVNTWQQDLSTPTQIPMFYLNGSGWVRDNPTAYPLKQGSVRPVYNLNSAGTWSTPDIDNNKFGVTFIIATNAINYPVLGIISQTQHANQSDAEGLNWSDLNLSGFPIVEFRPLYKIVYVTKTSYTNTPKATLVSIWDLRSFTSVVSAAASFVDANALSGTTLAAGVVNSSLTSVGTLANLTVTNTITGSISGSASTLTTSRNINGVGFNGSANINVDNITNGTNTVKIVSAPSSLTGAVGDTVGNMAFDSSYIYYCTTAYTPNSWTGTFTNSQGGSNSLQLTISNNWNPTNTLSISAGWTITFNPGGGNITRTVSSVASWSNQTNGYWTVNLTVNWTGTATSGSTFTVNSNAVLPNIWTQTPWNAITSAGNAATATKLATSRNINGVAFDGTAAITVTAAAGTLSGSELNSAVTDSSLTTVGTLASLSSGAITTTGTLAVNASGGITTNQTSVPLLNSTATTINFGGAATSLTMGASTGNTTVNNNLRVTGNINSGTNTYVKSPGAGDIAMDAGGTDTPGILMYYANNSNWGVDSWNGTFNILSGQLWRVVNNLNETGGAVRMAMDVYGNMVTTGFISPSAWRAGQVIKETILDYNDLTKLTQGGLNRFATDGNNRDVFYYSYTPSSNSSYLAIHFHLAKYTAYQGTGNDSYFSQIKVIATSSYSRDANGVGNGSEIAYSMLSTVNGNRTGSLFPLLGRYTNSDTNSKVISIAVRRESADDYFDYDWSATSVSMRITEIAR
jgi:hypothetical protein